MRNIITIIFTITGMAANAQDLENYRVIGPEEYEKILLGARMVKSYQDPNTLAHIELAENGFVLLWPAAGIQGLWIKDERTLDSLLKTKIPLSTNSVFAGEELQKHIQSMDIDYFISEIERTLCIQVRPIEVSDSYFFKIENTVNQYGLKKFSENFYVHFGYLLGELVRREYKVDWTITKQYGANPYYIPGMKTKNGLLITPYYKLNEHINSRAKFKIRKILDNLTWFCKADGAEKIR